MTTINKVVVVMFENRSYDNVLGYLYGPSNDAPYQFPPPGQSDLNGIPLDATNPGPNGPVSVHNQTWPATYGGTGASAPYASTVLPLVDPKEYFDDFAQQILGSATEPTTNPYASYATADGLMAGFVDNYAAPPAEYQVEVPPQNYGDVMNYFTPAQMPVTSWLARNYAVSDEWFASVPAQTIPNRNFALCAAPGVAAVEGATFSLIDDSQYLASFLDRTLLPPVPLRSICDQLDAMGISWKVYFHDVPISMVSVAAVEAACRNPDNQNVNTFDYSDWPQGATPAFFAAPSPSTFVDDLTSAAGLPQFSFIEPRYYDNFAPTKLPPNSNHPGYGNFPKVKLPLPPATNAPIDAATGELFLMQLYNMLQASPDWENTLLIITYDEHGGVFDHVAPLGATPPGGEIPPADPIGASPADPAIAGFDFNVFGVRVPAVIVSPQIAPGTTIRSSSGVPFDHTSIIRTVADLFIPPAGGTWLTDRDKAAPSLAPFLGPTAPTVPFGPQLLCGPMSLAFWSANAFPQTIFASAGPTIGVTASIQLPAGQNWLSMTGAPGSAATSLALTFSLDASQLPPAGATYQGEIVFDTVGTSVPSAPVSIPVTLIT